LAPGATPGQASLYVLHDGRIDFVTGAAGIVTNGGGVPFQYMTPDGRHLVFASTSPLTGNDNTDPVTGQPHSEVFEATIGAGIVCASCRADGSRPTGDSALPQGIAGEIRVMSDDGTRVFFQSTDAIVPQASNGLQKVFEYSAGRISLISAAGSSSAAAFLDASASGDDVFFETYDTLVPSPVGGDDAVYDARVDGGFPVTSHTECSGVSCRGPLGEAPTLAAPANGSGAGNLAPPVPAPPGASTSKPKTAAQIRAAKLAKALKACRSKRDKKKRAKCEKQARHAYGRRK